MRILQQALAFITAYFFTVTSLTAQPHINSLLPPTYLTEGANADIKQKLTELKVKVGDPEARRRIQSLIDRIETLDDAVRIAKVAEEIGDQNIADQLGTINKDLRDGALDPVSFSGDLALKPNPGEGENILAPSITGDYKFNKAIEFLARKINIGYDVHFQLQSSTASTDSSTIMRNILSSGGDGSVHFSVNAGLGDNWEAGFRINVQGGLSWLGERKLDTALVPGFAFGTGSYAITAWLNPIVVSYQTDFRGVSTREANRLASAVNRSMSGNLLVALKLQNDLFLQLKYLLASNKPVNHGESFEVRFVKAFSPF